MYLASGNLTSLFSQDPQDFYSRLIQLTNSLNQISVGFPSATSQPRYLSGSFDTPLGMQFRLSGRVYSQAANNAQEALSALSSVSTSLTRQGEILGELKTLAQTASDSATSASARQELSVQANALVEEYNSLNTSTSYNKLKLMDGSLRSFDVQLGYGGHNQFSGKLNTYTTRQVTTSYGGANATSSGISYLGTPQGFSNGDLNGDGSQDALVQDTAGLSNKLYVAISTKAGVNGNGSEAKINLTGTVNDSTLADINGDGKLDALAATTSGIEVAYGNGNGTFGASSILNAGSFNSINVTDINGDGTTDLVAVSSSGTVTTLKGSGGGVYTSASVATGITGISSSATGDINGDGYSDLAFIDSTGALYSRLGAADGSLGNQQLMGTVSGGLGSYELAIGQFNGDAQLDFAISGPSSSAVFFGQSDRTISSSNSFSLTSSAKGFVVADLNGDGRQDLLARTRTSDATIFQSDGKGSFSTNTIALGATSVGAVDTNGDGALDIVGGNHSTGFVTHLAQTSTTTAIPFVNLSTKAGGSQALTAIDALQTNLALETASIKGTQSVLSSALTHLNNTASVNFATAIRFRDAYTTQQNGLSALQSSISQSNFVTALLRRLLA